MDLFRETQLISPRLARWLQAIGEQPFDFSGQHPNEHSSYNHVHLWLLEYEADKHPQITIAFRCRVVSFIFEIWKQRLKDYKPYQEAGFRLYLYEDNAPTISVVAETSYGFPYGGQPVFVQSFTEVLEQYKNSSWRDRFQNVGNPETEAKRLLQVIERHGGSIGRPTANTLNTTTAKLRQRIEWLELQEAVNHIRRKYNRRPAQFLNPFELEDLQRYRIYELRLPARY